MTYAPRLTVLGLFLWALPAGAMQQNQGVEEDAKLLAPAPTPAVKFEKHDLPTVTTAATNKTLSTVIGKLQAITEKTTFAHRNLASYTLAYPVPINSPRVMILEPSVRQTLTTLKADLTAVKTKILPQLKEFLQQPAPAAVATKVATPAYAPQLVQVTVQGVYVPCWLTDGFTFRRGFQLITRPVYGTRAVSGVVQKAASKPGSVAKTTAALPTPSKARTKGPAK